MDKIHASVKISKTRMNTLNDICSMIKNEKNKN